MRVAAKVFYYPIVVAIEADSSRREERQRDGDGREVLRALPVRVQRRRRRARLPSLGEARACATPAERKNIWVLFRMITALIIFCLFVSCDVLVDVVPSCRGHSARQPRM